MRLYTGDIHYGSGTKYGVIDTATGMNTAVLDVQDSFNQIIKYCRDNNVEDFFLTGDIYKEGNGSADAKRREIFAKQLKELSSVVKRLHIIVGNHDIYGDTNIYSDMKPWFPDNVFVYDKPTYETITNTVIIPYFNITKAIDSVKADNTTDANYIISKIISDIVDGLFASISQDKKATATCVFHLTLSESEYKEGVVTKWGHDIIMSSHNLSAKFLRSFGGHLHEPQDIRNCHYHGSITQTEVNQKPRSFISYDITTDTVERVPLQHRKIHSVKATTAQEAIAGMQSLPKTDSVVLTLSKSRKDYDLHETEKIIQEGSSFHTFHLKYTSQEIKNTMSEVVLTNKTITDKEALEDFFKNDSESKEVLLFAQNENIIR